MFDENQLVEMKWNIGTKTWYENNGYTFTRLGDVFYVKAKDLRPTSQKNVVATCDYCGNEYITEYGIIRKGMESNNKNCCHSCCAKKAHERWKPKRIINRFKKIEEICKERGYKLITTVDEYVDGNTIIVYECLKHGIQNTKANYFCEGSGCRECRLETISISNSLTQQEVEEIVESVNGNILLNSDEYDKYSTHNLKILCSCGNVYTTSLSSYVHYNVTRCPTCAHSESKSEARIKLFLENNNIDYRQEYSFDGCRYLHKLPFDFYLPNYNVIIEYNGKQHYEPIDYFGGEDAFELRQIRDKIKYDYCKNNGIKLIRIPYWEENNIEKILTQELNL